MNKFFRELTNQELEFHILEMREKHCTIIRNILTKKGFKYLESNIVFDDFHLGNKAQFFRRHNTEISLPSVDRFHKDTKNTIKKIIGNEFETSYSFAMEYVKGSELTPHLDLPNNAISATLCYETNEDYEIFIDKDYRENNSLTRINSQPRDRNNALKLNIGKGDIGIFNGRNHLHWRNKATDTVSYKALLMHYWIPNI